MFVFLLKKSDMLLNKYNFQNENVYVIVCKPEDVEEVTNLRNRLKCIKSPIISVEEDYFKEVDNNIVAINFFKTIYTSSVFNSQKNINININATVMFYKLGNMINSFYEMIHGKFGLWFDNIETYEQLKYELLFYNWRQQKTYQRYGTLTRNLELEKIILRVKPIQTKITAPRLGDFKLRAIELDSEFYPNYSVSICLHLTNAEMVVYKEKDKYSLYFKQLYFEYLCRKIKTYEELF